MDLNAVITWLRKLFWIYGILGLIGYCLSLATSLYYTQNPTPFMSSDSFNLSSQIYLLTSALSFNFLLLLVSRVFSLIQNEDLDKEKQTELILRITCGAFTAQGLSKLFGAIWSFLAIFGQSLTNPFYLLGGILNFISVFEPLFYAVTIYILYRHFHKLIKFDAEVI